MATNTERIVALEAETKQLKVGEAVLVERLEAMKTLADSHRQGFIEEQNRLRSEVSQLKAEYDALRAALTESEKRNAVLEAAVKELKAGADKWGQRWWQLAAGIALAVVGGVAGYLLKR